MEKQLSAMADSVRMRMLCLLEGEELQVGEVARVLQLPQSTVSRHVKRLVDAGLISRRVQGAGSWLHAEPNRVWKAARVGLAYPEDEHRLKAVLALRQMDSAEFFGRHAAEWDEMRSQLFGRDYVLPTLAALLPEGQFSDNQPLAMPASWGPAPQSWAIRYERGNVGRAT